MSAAPYFVKQDAVKELAIKYRSKYFIETGTLYGDMVDYAASLGVFERVFSIELSDAYFGRAKNRFRRNSIVDLRHGDSGEVLPSLLKEISNTAIFWLDGHYSGSNTAKLDGADTPVSQELAAIFEHGRIAGVSHVILVDDARCFDGTNGYPLISSLKAEIDLKHRDYFFEVRDDMIRILPR